jgi:hypothetical protein
MGSRLRLLRKMGELNGYIVRFSIRLGACALHAVHLHLWDDSCGAAAYLTNFCVCATSWKLETENPVTDFFSSRSEGEPWQFHCKFRTIWVIPGI